MKIAIAFTLLATVSAFGIDKATFNKVRDANLVDDSHGLCAVGCCIRDFTYMSMRLESHTSSSSSPNEPNSNPLLIPS